MLVIGYTHRRLHPPPAKRQHQERGELLSHHVLPHPAPAHHLRVGLQPAQGQLLRQPRLHRPLRRLRHHHLGHRRRGRRLPPRPRRPRLQAQLCPELRLRLPHLRRRPGGHARHLPGPRRRPHPQHVGVRRVHSQRRRRHCPHHHGSGIGYVCHTAYGKEPKLG